MKLFMLATLLLCSVAMADEIVLKNGKRIQWKSVSDEGESYSVQTKDGQTVTLKKSEVERFSTSDSDNPANGPLTGATFAFDAKKTMSTDLMPKADLKGDPSWKAVGKTLVANATWPTRSVMIFDYPNLPEEYDLTAVVERSDSGNKDFAIGVLGAGGQCAFHFDAWDGSASCLALIEGKEGEHVNGQAFKKDKARLVKVMVRKEALIIQVDGKDFWKTRIDWKQVSLHQAVSVKEKGKPFLVAAGGAWKVSSFTVTQIK